MAAPPPPQPPDGGALRVRVRIGPRSPLHATLAALPPQEQTRVLLRLAEAGVRGEGAGTDPASSGGASVGASTDDAAPENRDLTAAVARLAAGVERLAARLGAGGPDSADPAKAGADRAAGLDDAWS